MLPLLILALLPRIFITTDFFILKASAFCGLGLGARWLGHGRGRFGFGVGVGLTVRNLSI